MRNPCLGAASRVALIFVMALLVGLSAHGGAAHARGAPDGFADLVERLTPAVVNVSITQRPPEDTESDDPETPSESPAEEFFERGGPGRGVLPPPETALGSGFIIDPAGYVVTNAHVIAGAEEITVVLADGRRLKAETVGRDRRTDLALLKVDAKAELPYVSFGDSNDVRVGDWIIAIGNPFGLGNSVTAGIISARGRDINAGPYDDFFQTDAPINRGNSGGPMFNMAGEVIGINTLIFSPSGGSVGIGFATPSSLALPVIEQLRTYGHTRRGWLGVRIQTVTPDLAKRFGLEKPRGALVAEVLDGGPAEAAKIEAGDIILRFDGKEIPSRRKLPRVVAGTKIGGEVEIVLWRDGGEVKVKAEIGEFDETIDLAARQPPTERPAIETVEALGLTLSAITPELAARFDLEQDAEGVVVTEVDEAVAVTTDIRPGDLIVEVAHEAVSTPKDIAAKLREIAKGDVKWVLVLRDRHGERQSVAVRLGDD